ncbi:MAG: glycosyltransferase [Gemmatimonadaceae bacterium]|jgi:alpha-1,6-mannosyltransferase|nr:glycosyltransferase [Gemmatimonadota bacterium]
MGVAVHPQPRVHIGEGALPPRLRPQASLGVLDITEWYGDTSGGIKTYLREKAEYVASRPWLRHILVVPGDRDHIRDAGGGRTYRLHGPPIPRQRPYRFMLATRSVSRIVQHERPDLIEIGSPFIVPWIVRHATRALDVPLVCFHHTNLPEQFAPRDAAAGVLHRVMHRAVWDYMRRLDRLFPLTIVASRAAARDLTAAGIDRIERVPLGVDLQRFTPAHRVHSALTRARHGLPDAPLAGYVGRFAREKEIDVVLDGWAGVERATGARLVLIGAGPMERRLRAHRYGARVIFVPYQHDRDALADLLAALDVYVAPGPIETFGLSALEALASGVPVLSVNRGGVADLVTDSGAGRLFEWRTPASVTAQAVALLRDDLATLGQRARAFAEAEHSWETVFDRLFAVYRRVLRRA